MTDPNLHHHHPACDGNGCQAEQEKEPTPGGLCGLLMKKVGGGPHDDQKTSSDVDMADIEHQEVKHGGNPTLVDQLHRSDGGSSSSEEDGPEGEGGEKKRKKRGMKERIKKKLSGEKEEDHLIDHQQQPEIIITGDIDDNTNGAANQATLIQMHEDDSEEKKGFIEKFMDKLPLYGQEIKKPEDEDRHLDIENQGGLEGHQHKEKGILNKIKEKIPGSHMSNGDYEAKKED